MRIARRILLFCVRGFFEKTYEFHGVIRGDEKTDMGAFDFPFYVEEESAPVSHLLAEFLIQV
jgi:hypothetical protein